MVRSFALACAVVVAACVPVSPSAAQTVHTPQIACRLLLPEAPIPDNPGHSIMILEVTVPGGHDGHRHQHDSVEYLHVLGGNGSLAVYGRPDTPLSPGMVITIPRKTPHQARNSSETAPLVFSATFIEADADTTITAYIGEADTVNGCPHRR